MINNRDGNRKKSLRGITNCTNMEKPLLHSQAGAGPAAAYAGPSDAAASWPMWPELLRPEQELLKRPLTSVWWPPLTWGQAEVA